MTVRIDTIEEALELLRRAVDERGEDHVAERYVTTTPDGDAACRYFSPTGEPGCIVGHVLHYKGATPSEVPEFMGVGALAGRGVLVAPAAVLAVLAEAQGTQDMGKSWGHALDCAEELAVRFA